MNIFHYIRRSLLEDKSQVSIVGKPPSGSGRFNPSQVTSHALFLWSTQPSAPPPTLLLLTNSCLSSSKCAWEINIPGHGSSPLPALSSPLPLPAVTSLSQTHNGHSAPLATKVSTFWSLHTPDSRKPLHRKPLQPPHPW